MNFIVMCLNESFQVSKCVGVSIEKLLSVFEKNVFGVNSIYEFYGVFLNKQNEQTLFLLLLRAIFYNTIQNMLLIVEVCIINKDVIGSGMETKIAMMKRSFCQISKKSRVFEFHLLLLCRLFSLSSNVRTLLLLYIFGVSDKSFEWSIGMHILHAIYNFNFRSNSIKF